MGIMGVDREKEWFIFFFCLGQKVQGETGEFFGISSHSRLIIISMGRLTELAPLGSMFANHSGKVTLFP